jgi:hypothetical protein
MALNETKCFSFNLNMKNSRIVIEGLVLSLMKPLLAVIKDKHPSIFSNKQVYIPN